VSADPYPAPAGLSLPAAPGPTLRRWWGRFAALLTLAVFTEAVFAGAMLSGAPWARPAHAATAMALIASAVAASLAALVTLRRVAGGPRLGRTLLALAGALVLQAALGAMTRHGANLLWLHVPLGVALVGLAGQAWASARRL
jgi:hypothetical protein